jgi:hypothetical protein
VLSKPRQVLMINRADNDGGAEEERILTWLSPAKFSERHTQAKNNRTPGTGKWLLDLKEYKDWLDSSCGFLWLHGVGEFTMRVYQE